MLKRPPSLTQARERDIRQGYATASAEESAFMAQEHARLYKPADIQVARQSRKDRRAAQQRAYEAKRAYHVALERDLQAMADERDLARMTLEALPAVMRMRARMQMPDAPALAENAVTRTIRPEAHGLRHVRYQVDRCDMVDSADRARTEPMAHKRTMPSMPADAHIAHDLRAERAEMMREYGRLVDGYLKSSR